MSLKNVAGMSLYTLISAGFRSV